MKFEDVPERQAFLLAEIFRHPDSEHWATYAERVYSIEPQLDRAILRPDLLHRLVQPPQSRYTPLCSLHKILDARIVHKVFLLVSMEVGVRLNRLVVAGRDQLGHQIWDCNILNLRSLHGAWLQPEVFWDTFGKTLDVPKGGCSKEDYMTKWICEENKCEACVLSRIGGDLSTVLDLQMAVNSRIHTRSRRRHRQPRLSKIIEGWLHAWEPYFDAREWQIKLETNRTNIARLKDARRKIAKEKRSNSTNPGEQNERGLTRDQAMLSAPARGHGGNTVQRERYSHEAQPSHRQSTETIKVYLSSPPNDQRTEVDAATSDGEEDGDLRQTIYNTENEIIDCYAALISTPFLPGMDTQQHHKRATLLSRHCSEFNRHSSDKFWPLVGTEKAQERLTRSQSINHRRPSNYSESVYSQNHTATLEPSTLPRERLSRSHSVQNKRASDRSWITASIPPSIAATHAESIGPEQRRRSKKSVADGKATEEASVPRSKDTRLREIPVSPIREETETKNERISTRNRSRPHSPVSPISPSAPASPVLRAAHRNHLLHDPRPPHTTSCRTGSESRDMGYDQDRFQSRKLGSRLSKPLEGPALEGGRSSYFSEDLHERAFDHKPREKRGTVSSDVTRWSALYGSEATRIKELERQYDALNTEADPKSNRRRRNK